jgi:hypothetical protein
VLERRTKPDEITKELFYICKLTAQDLSKQTGEEFSDPSRGGYDLEWVRLDPYALASLNIKPEEVKKFLMQNCKGLSQLRDLRSEK